MEVTEQPDPDTVVVTFYRDTDVVGLVSKEGYRLAYGGVPLCWRVKPEDYPDELA